MFQLPNSVVWVFSLLICLFFVFYDSLLLLLQCFLRLSSVNVCFICVFSFLLLWWNTWENQVKEDVYFGSQFLLIVDWLYCFGPKVRQNIRAKESCSPQLGRREKGRKGERERERMSQSRDRNNTFQRHTPSDSSLPTRLYESKVFTIS